MVLNARMRPRSGFEPRFCQRPSEDDRNSPVAPFGFAITVESPPSANKGFVGPPTRTGSLSPDSLAKVLHSEVSSIECDSSTSPHSEHTVSPAEWSKTTSVCLLQSEQYASDIFACFSMLCYKYKQYDVVVVGLYWIFFFPLSSPFALGDGSWKGEEEEEEEEKRNKGREGVFIEVTC